MTTNEIRSQFLEFFKSKGHAIVASDSVVPKDDPTVLFTTAGMQQFKPQFLGRDLTYRRAATCQKCLRTDDLDKVGKSDVHHTFFEMLGNFSFGDYFKKEAIAWGWEFLTQWMKLPKEKLWVSVYKDDEEAYGIWLNDIRIPNERIVKLGDKSNFWPSNARIDGPNGPCGPCSEIFYDYGVNPNCPKGKDCDPDCSCGRFSEIWNLVFTQFNRKDGGVLEPLPAKNIDTGMGLERLVATLQGVKSNYETDIFRQILKTIQEMMPAVSQVDARIIADHMRAIVFAVADGVVPSNKERGFVVKKLIITVADIMLRTQGITWAKNLVSSVVVSMAGGYPDLKDKLSEIEQCVGKVEKDYERILEIQIPELKTRIWDLPKILSHEEKVNELGEVFFFFRDTYGLSAATIKDVALDAGVTPSGYEAAWDVQEQLMEEQKNRSRAASKMTGDVFADAGIKLDVAKTEFLGYSVTEADAKALRVFTDGQQVKVILDRTPFYAESGGQTGDTGFIRSANAAVRVLDTQKINDIFIHIGAIESGQLKEGDKVKAQVDSARRLSIMRNHTATHLLQAALRETLGSHIKQQGSLVAPDRLRFDFTHPQGVRPQEIEKIEGRINQFIQNADKVSVEVLPIEEARKKGALAFFAEKYGEKVRVVSIGDYSREFCGGTHLSSTNQAEAFKIVSEGSVAQGIRRIEAVTGQDAVSQVFQQRQKEEAAKQEAQRLKQLEKEQQNVRFEAVKASVDQIIANAENIKGISVITYCMKDADMGMLRKLSDLLKQKAKSAIMLLAAQNPTDASLIISVTDDLVAKGVKANDLLGKIAPLFDASGGGRPQLAQAGGKQPQKLDSALVKAREIVKANI